MENKVLLSILSNLVGDSEDYGSVDKYFKPIWIVRSGYTRYSVNKEVKRLRELKYITYISVGGGVDDHGDPTPPWNGYTFTDKGLEWIKKEYPKYYTNDFD